jgi:hypothetical protein
MSRMPKVIDYAGRFAFFELACFTLVRDQGVERLSRHGIAKVLATSISTIRRLLSPEADLRTLALNEVAVRRRGRTRARVAGTGVDAGLEMLRPLLPDEPAHIAEELVWWRLVVAAPSTAVMPMDHDEEGPLHHRFSIANYGFVLSDVLRATIEPPRSATPDGEDDPIVAARRERHAETADRAARVVAVVAPELGEAQTMRHARALHALVDGVGVTVALGSISPDVALGIVRERLEDLALTRPR